jgi:type VI secretion system protein VasG
MAAIDLKPLVARLNEHCRRALEAAAGLTLSRSHYNVELEHWLLKLVDGTDTDIAAILRHYEADHGRLMTDLERGLDRMKTGNARAPSLSPDIVEAAKQAWLLASVEQGVGRVRSGHLLWAMLADETLARRTREVSSQFLKIPPDALKRDFAAVTRDSVEAAAASQAAEGAPAAAGGDPAAGPRAGLGALDQFTLDLTAQARAGKIDPILGRDTEIRQVIDILTRRRQNNPILTGEAGVGKTAVVEGFALRIAAGEVPEVLRDVSVRTLDLGLLQAGAGVKGEFENRLKSVIEETKASPKPIILFIDEAHTLIGAGGAAGQNDAANLLKPALARGELRTIAATTWAEYKKYFEKDAALTRRFQVVRVEEPAEPVAIAMVRGLVSILERHHRVRILDEAVSAAVHLSARFIPSRQLPDKAVSLIDTACARVAMSQSTIPSAIEDRERRIGLIDTELAVLDRESATGGDHAARRDALMAERSEAETALADLRARFEEERSLVAAIGDLRGRIEGSEGGFEDKDALRAQLAETVGKLRALQGEQPLIHPAVDAQAVAEIVESWTGIPAGRMQSDEIRTVLNLKEAMEQRIVGQPHALEAVAQAIRTSRAKLTDPRKPIGVFLMVGTSGTGKTETALTLANLLYGGEQNMTTINMTEFKEEHKVSLLMGSPPGYVGYGEGGILTEAVRRRPYSVVLLDEMEKAHPGVQDVFFQVFDKGQMKDGEGRDIDFKNTVIIMTSNAGTDLIAKLFADPETAPDAAGLAEALMPELMKHFKPAFLGRVTMVPYFPLSDAVIRRIVELQLGRVRARVRDAYGAAFDYDPALVETIAARCTESSAGARNVENILSRTLLPELSGEVLARLAEGQTIHSVHVGMDPDGSFRYNLG